MHFSCKKDSIPDKIAHFDQNNRANPSILFFFSAFHPKSRCSVCTVCPNSISTTAEPSRLLQNGEKITLEKKERCSPLTGATLVVNYSIKFLTAEGAMDKNDISSIASLLKSMAHPIRLEILCRLRDGELSVADLQTTVQTTNGNLSQHLAVLRNQGIITCRREGNFIYNRIRDNRIEVLMNSLQTLFCPDSTPQPQTNDRSANDKSLVKKKTSTHQSPHQQ
jgi:ArsR family transcriptional regulator